MEKWDIFVLSVLDGVRKRLREDEEPRMTRPRHDKEGKAVFLSIHRDEGLATPAVDLTPFYLRYRKGELAIDEAVDEIIDGFSGIRRCADTAVGCVRNWEEAESRLTVRLLKRKGEGEEDGILRLPYLDMELVFHLFIWSDERSFITVPVNRSWLEGWRKTAEEVKEAAIRSTLKIHPLYCKPMEEALLEMYRECGGEVRGEDVKEGIGLNGKPPLFYVLTNQRKSYGAAAVLYPGVLKGLAEREGDDLIILPGSVHEMLAVPAGGVTDIGCLRGYVRVVNGTEVAPGDVLSDQVYIYRRALDKMEIAA